jgi:hypothetical protein
MSRQRHAPARSVSRWSFVPFRPVGVLPVLSPPRSTRRVVASAAARLQINLSA